MCHIYIHGGQNESPFNSLPQTTTLQQTTLKIHQDKRYGKNSINEYNSIE